MAPSWVIPLRVICLWYVGAIHFIFFLSEVSCDEKNSQEGCPSGSSWLTGASRLTGQSGKKKSLFDGIHGLLGLVAIDHDADFHFARVDHVDVDPD